MSPPHHLLLLILAAAVVAVFSGDDLSLSPSEQEAAYLALESIDPATSWRDLYSSDLCLSGPHGIVCDLFSTTNNSSSPSSSIHITELNFGFVSDYSSNPACAPSSAALPSSLSSLPFLRKIFFYDCFSISKTNLHNTFFRTLPPSLEQIVFINNPALAGRLTGAIGSFPDLKRLIFINTAVSGSIPAEIGGLQSLTQLVLSRNRIRGSIPASIGNLKNLKILDLSGNRISGNIPAQIGSLNQLVKLDLGSNRVSGPIPSEFERLRMVEFLDLSSNNLTGGVPAAIGSMVRLKDLYLSGNSLGGEIPEIWGNLRGILGIGMSRIGLIGNIPASMGLFLEKVSYLGLDGNYLEGRVPFSAGFVNKMGGKLKVGGNDKLCLGKELVGHVRGRGSVGELVECKKMEIPHPVLFSSGAASLLGRGILGVLVVVLAL